MLCVNKDVGVSFDLPSQSVHGVHYVLDRVLMASSFGHGNMTRTLQNPMVLAGAPMCTNAEGEGGGYRLGGMG